MDATSIFILLPTLVLLSLICIAYKSRLQRLGKQSFEVAALDNSALEIYDPPLSEAEAKFVTGNHTMELHGQWLFRTYLLFAILNASATVWLGFSPNEPVAIIWWVSLLISASSFLILPLVTMRSCGCGAMRVLSPRTRLNQLWTIRSYATFSLKREMKSLTILFCLCAILLSTLIGLCVLVSQFYSIIFPGARVATAAAITVPTIILAMLGIASLFVDTSKRFISKAELERVTSLRGETAEELSELIAFYERVGNFRKTDEYSKKLLDITSVQ